MRPHPASPAGVLELAEPPEKNPSPNQGRAGFDPYGNDAGFAKPHSWERVDHD